MLNLKNKNDLGEKDVTSDVNAFVERFEWMYKKESVAADSIRKKSLGKYNIEYRF